MAKSSLENPRQLLNIVINLMAKDIKAIYDLSHKGKLEHEVANDLVRYGTCLLALSKDTDVQYELARKQFGKLSMDELSAKVEIALKEIKGITIEPPADYTDDSKTTAKSKD